MASYGFIFGIMVGVGGIFTLALIIPQGESDIITTGICNIQINGTTVKACSQIHDSINFNSTRQLGILYNETTKAIQYDVMTNSTKFTWHVLSDPAGVTWLAQPAGSTELLDLTQFRIKLDLSGYDEVRLNGIVATVGLSGSILSVQYSSDCSTWSDIATINPTLALDAISMKTSAWQKIVPSAKADVCLRIIGSGGNGILNPIFNGLNVQFR